MEVLPRHGWASRLENLPFLTNAGIALLAIEVTESPLSDESLREASLEVVKPLISARQERQ